jgi:hypothetical protein
MTHYGMPEVTSDPIPYALSSLSKLALFYFTYFGSLKMIISDIAFYQKIID